MKTLHPILAATVFRAAARWGAAKREDIDEIVQNVYVKIGAMKNVSPFENEVVAAAYFRVMAANAAVDFFKAKFAERRDAGKTEAVDARLEQIVPAALPDADRSLVLREIDAALPEDKRDRSVFWLYYLQGFTASEISVLPGIGLSVKGVESLIGRLTGGIRRKFDGKTSKGNSAAGSF